MLLFQMFKNKHAHLTQKQITINGILVKPLAVAVRSSSAQQCFIYLISIFSHISHTRALFSCDSHRLEIRSASHPALERSVKGAC